MPLDGHQPFGTGEEFLDWSISMLKSIGNLTWAETRVCEHLMLGRRYRDVAAIEAISEETVRWHAKRILRKLDAANTREFFLVIGRGIDEGSFSRCDTNPP
jgi:DNA-binding CsgD family transcriptional regulator